MDLRMIAVYLMIVCLRVGEGDWWRLSRSRNLSRSATRTSGATQSSALAELKTAPVSKLLQDRLGLTTAALRPRRRRFRRPRRRPPDPRYKPQYKQKVHKKTFQIPSPSPVAMLRREVSTTESPISSTTTTTSTAPDNHYQGVKVSSCYVCGLQETGIPTSTLCHDAFESPDGSWRYKARFLRQDCYRNPNNKYAYTTIPNPRKQHKQKWYGQFIGGCFKRFLDIGLVYTQRGCRSWPPGPRLANATQRSLATRRFRKLELMLGRQPQDKCVFSPYAALTPFARDISLFARYHVCVCRGDFCNRGHSLRATALLSLALLLILNIKAT